MKRIGIVLTVIWLVVWFALASAQVPDAQIPDDMARIHYSRADAAFEGWLLHVWEDTTESVTWAAGLEPTGTDDFGVYWDVGLQPDAELLGFLVHQGDEKDPGPDMFLELGETREAWIISGDTTMYTSLPDPDAAQVSGDLTTARAHWLDATTLVWDAVPDGAEVVLYSDSSAGLELTENGVQQPGPTPVAITTFEVTLQADPEGLSEELRAKFPHLAEYAVYKTDLDAEAATEFLRGQLVLAALDADGKLLDATGVQIPGVLDDLYAEDAADVPLGVSWTGDTPAVRVWAPTAQTVKFHLFADASGDAEEVLELTRSDTTGVWGVSGDPDWNGKYYLFEVQVYAPSTQKLETNLVTDPYSLSLSTNSTRSQIVDLDDPTLQPEGWDTLAKPTYTAPEDVSVYELHVRDFSVGDATVPEPLRGTYGAFSVPDSAGTQHLRALAQAGLTHLHLLPVFDIATIDEDKSHWQTPAGDLASYPPNSAEQQAAVDAVRDQDAFNWGYDPLHYTVPEGSYAGDPAGAARILEFRQMIKSLNESGLRVVMDVVYNHTNSSGQAELSVLDRVVPGYYHRLNADGLVETSTCCQNTATEHAMMEKLMVDSLLTWARDYKVDGFRFDLMGHHLVRNMEAVQDALESLTEAEDGVDGSHIHLYGEGWDFGEVAGNARGENATQRNLAGTGIGTFNDRLRDAARGGTPFSGPQEQGFITGLYTDPNGSAQGTESEQLGRLLSAGDQIRVGLAGNLADYTFESANGETVSGADIPYGDAPAGYTRDPQENIVYVSAHDNETLFDAVALKAPLATPMRERVRMQNLGLSLVALSQGVPFFHAGSDLLRSKSLDRNSYNSGDWFNKLDFSYQTNNWGVGLPPGGENEANWPLMSRLLGEVPAPTETDIRRSAEHLREVLAIRNSSPLFRLGTAEAVQNQLSFYNTGLRQVPGVIVMHLAAEQGAVEGAGDESIIVVFNGTPELQELNVPELGGRYQLHPVQQMGSDPLVKFARARADGTLTVPGRTTAVFIGK